MKTTIEIADSLLEEAKRVAAEQDGSLRALVEEGLRKVVGDRRHATTRFRLRKASFKGKGMQEGVEEGNWESLRDSIYEGRGA